MRIGFRVRELLLFAVIQLIVGKGILHKMLGDIEMLGKLPYFRKSASYCFYDSLAGKGVAYCPCGGTALAAPAGNNGAACIVKCACHAVSEFMYGFLFSVGKTFHLTGVDSYYAHTVCTLAHCALSSFHAHIDYKYIILFCYF